MFLQGSLAVGDYCLIAFHVSSFIQSKLFYDLDTDFANGSASDIILFGYSGLTLWLAIDHCQKAFCPHGSSSVIAIGHCVKQAYYRLITKGSR